MIYYLQLYNRCADSMVIYMLKNCHREFNINTKCYSVSNIISKNTDNDSSTGRHDRDQIIHCHIVLNHIKENKYLPTCQWLLNIGVNSNRSTNKFICTSFHYASPQNWYGCSSAAYVALADMSVCPPSRPIHPNSSP